MKKILSILTFIFICVATFAQQAVMPTIIVFPSDAWMNDHGYAEPIDNDGETEYRYKYNDAFVQTREMGTAIQAVQKVFEERKFNHEDLQALLRDMKRERAEEIAKKADGYGAEKNAMDELMQQARPDIRVDLDYSVKPGRFKDISYSLKATDAYTSEQVASVEGTIMQTVDPVDLAMRKAIAGNCDAFCQQIIDYFIELRNNGRKINVVFRVADGASINFIKDEIGEDEETYDEFLYSWVKKHAVNRECKKGRKSPNMVEFKGVRIPFFNEDGDPIEAEDWAKGIRKAFRAETGIKVTKDEGNSLGRVGFLVGQE